MEFELKKGGLFFSLLVLFPCFIILAATLTMMKDVSSMDAMRIFSIAIILLALFALLYFLLFKTYYDSKYRIDGGTLWCKMGLFKQKINIKTIDSITESDYPAAGNRPALNLNGIIINYGTGYSIFLSPADKLTFINNLQQINPRIKVLK